MTQVVGTVFITFVVGVGVAERLYRRDRGSAVLGLVAGACLVALVWL